MFDLASALENESLLDRRRPLIVPGLKDPSSVLMPRDRLA